LMMPNMLQYPIALAGALRAVLVGVNTNPLYTPRDMPQQCKESGVLAILIAETFAHNLAKILPDTEIKMRLVTRIGEMLGTIKGGIVNFMMRKVTRMVPKYDLPNVVKFSDAIKAGGKFKIPDFENTPDDVIFLQYTGGTMGVSKGAMLTNRN